MVYDITYPYRTEFGFSVSYCTARQDKPTCFVWKCTDPINGTFDEIVIGFLLGVQTY